MEAELIFSASALTDDAKRTQIMQALKEKEWDMKVLFLKEKFCFLAHPQFPDNVFCSYQALDGGKPDKGGSCHVVVSVSKDMTRGKFGYKVFSGTVSGGTARTRTVFVPPGQKPLKAAKVEPDQFYRNRTDFFSAYRMGTDEAIFILYLNKAMTNLSLCCGMKVQQDFKADILKEKINALDEKQLNSLASFISPLTKEACTDTDSVRAACVCVFQQIAELRNFFSHAKNDLGEKTIRLDDTLYHFLGKLSKTVEGAMPLYAQTIAKIPLFRTVVREEGPRKFKKYQELTKSGIIFLICLVLYKNEAEEFCSLLSDMRKHDLYESPLREFYTALCLPEKRQLLDNTDLNFVLFADIISYLNKVPSASLEGLSLNSERERLASAKASSLLSEENKATRYELHERTTDKFASYALCCMEDFNILPHLSFKTLDPAAKMTRNPYCFLRNREDEHPLSRYFAVEKGSVQFEWRFPEDQPHHGCIPIQKLHGVMTDNVLQQILYLFLNPAGLKISRQPDDLLNGWLAAYHALLEKMLDHAVREQSIDPEDFMAELQILTRKTPDQLRQDFATCAAPVIGPGLTSFFSGVQQPDNTFDVRKEILRKAQSSLDQDLELSSRFRKEKLSDALLIRQVFRFFNLQLESTPWQFRQLPLSEQHRGCVDFEYQTVHGLIGKYTLDPKALWKHFQKMSEKADRKSTASFCAATRFSAAEAVDYCKSRAVILENAKKLKRCKTLEELSYQALQECIREEAALIKALSSPEETDFVIREENLIRRFGIRKPRDRRKEDIFRTILKIDPEKWSYAFNYETRKNYGGKRSLQQAQNLIVSQITLPDDLIQSVLADLQPNKNNPRLPWNDVTGTPDIRTGIRRMESGIRLRDYYNVDVLVQWLKDNTKRHAPMQVCAQARTKVDKTYKDIRKVHAHDKLLLAVALKYRERFRALGSKLKFNGDEPVTVYDFYDREIACSAGGLNLLMHLNDFNKPSVTALLNRKDVLSIVKQIPGLPNPCPLETLRIEVRKIEAADRRIRREYIIAVQNFYDSLDDVPHFSCSSKEELYGKIAEWLLAQKLVSGISKEEIVRLICFRNALFHDHFGLEKEFSPETMIRPALERLSLLAPKEI